MKIGLLAGEGLLPFAFAENTKAMGLMWWHSDLCCQAGAPPT